jgi:hypothetical protein
MIAFLIALNSSIFIYNALLALRGDKPSSHALGAALNGGVAVWLIFGSTFV